MKMDLGAEGLALLKGDEGLRLHTYDDATGKTVGFGDDYAGVLTIGYGHTGPEATPGRTVTVEGAEQLLLEDVQARLPQINGLLKVPLNQNQFDAVFCLGYNIGFGPRGLGGSTLLRKLNAGDILGAAAEFRVWNKSGGKVIAGLVKRRADEAALFGKPLDEVNA